MNIEFKSINGIEYIYKDGDTYWFVPGTAILQKFGTSEGVKLAWESREHGDNNEKSNKDPLKIDSYSEAGLFTHINLSNGTKILFKTSQPNMKRLSNSVISKLDSLPEALKSSIKKIYVLKEGSSGDKNKTDQYKDKFISSAGSDINSGTIKLYNGKVNQDDIIHEASHLFDNKNKISRSSEYMNIVNNKWLDKYTTDTAKINYSRGLEEDFAESVVKYIKEPDKFSNKYPDRAKFIKNSLKI
jgi:hypothetical protein